MNWGMMWNGNCLTVKFMFHKKFKIKISHSYRMLEATRFSKSGVFSCKIGDRKIAETILKNKIDHYSCSDNKFASNSQLYKSAGNSVTVSIIHEIAKCL